MRWPRCAVGRAVARTDRPNLSLSDAKEQSVSSHTLLPSLLITRRPPPSISAPSKRNWQSSSGSSSPRLVRRTALGALSGLMRIAGGGGSGPGVGFDVARTGIASVGFVGCALPSLLSTSVALEQHAVPSVGKSSLMSGLTGTTSEVAAYGALSPWSASRRPPDIPCTEFTTLTTVPGTLNVHGAKVQILDLPGIIEGAKDGKGRGRQVIAGAWPSHLLTAYHTNHHAVARSCNLLFIVLDVLKPLGDKKIIEDELEGFGIRSVCASVYTIDRGRLRTGSTRYRRTSSSRKRIRAA